MKQNRLIKQLLFVVILSISACHAPDFLTRQTTHPALQSHAIPSGLGVNIHFFKGNEKDYSMISESGLDMVRMDALWETIEKKPGVYDFSKMDRLVNDLEKNKLRLLCILCYGNPLYDNGLAPHTSIGRAAYASFCEALVGHFAGKGIIWELWNEPNSDKFWPPKSNIPDYMTWCKTVVPAIRKADPQACIVAPATSDFDIPFVEACFENGLLELVDGISVHPYRNPKRGPETTCDEYENLKVLIDFYKPAGKNIPIISGEWGYSSFFVSDELQGKYLSRQWLSNMASGIPVSIWYDWHDDGPDSLNAEHNFGTVTVEYEPKPAFTAMKTLINQLRGYHFTERLATGNDDDQALLFSDGTHFKLALWTSGSTHNFIPEEGMKISDLVTSAGNSIQANTNFSIPVNDSPIYANIEEPVPAYLMMLETANSLSLNERIEAVQFISGQSKSESNFSGSLKKIQEKGTKPERMAAWQILTKLAQSAERTSSGPIELYYKILDSDAPDRSKKQALYHLSVIGSEESAPTVEPFLHKPEFSASASVYYMQLAYQFAGNKKFQEALDALYKGTKATGLRYGAERALRKMEEMGWKDSINRKEMARQNGFINSWNLAGPFPNDETSEKHTAWFPEKGFDPAQSRQFGDYTAKCIKVDVDNIWGIVPLAKMFGRNKLSMYAYQEIEIDNDTEAIFKVGSNDGVICRVNGEVVHENIVDRALTIDEDVFNVKLRKGKNLALLTILNSGGNWEFCLRICDRNGMPLKTIH
ncbi:MAG: cellulase family glycosylhydrolase [Bacteroidota bacterium]|nr:cellulase family glycosylhydrolase [Bacteroidota bacterium]